MKDAKNVTITDSEWMVMRAIWTMGHATSRELIDAMNELEGWSAPSTNNQLVSIIYLSPVANLFLKFRSENQILFNEKRKKLFLSNV